MDSLYALTRLQALLDDHFTSLQVTRPAIAAWAGTPIAALPDASLGAAKDEAQFGRAVLTALDRIDVQALEEDDYVSWLTLRWDMAALSGWPAFFQTRLTDVAPGASPMHTASRVLRGQRVADSVGARRFRALVDGVPRMVGAVHEALAERASRGIRIAAFLLPRAVEHVRSFIAPPAASPFGVPAPGAPADSPWAAALERAVAEAITTRVNPALDSLARFLEGDYWSKAPAAAGLSQYPGGLAHYRALLRFHTTLDITPEDAHAIGLVEVSRLAARAGAARAEAELPADRDSLRELLRRDARFTAGDSDSAAAMWVNATAGRLYQEAARQLDSLFRPGPASPLAISAMSPEEARGGPLSLYDPPSVPDQVARYRLNVTRWRHRSLLELPALVFEDLMPGLHHQQATQREDGLLPSSRRVAWHGGFVRGWQVYALALADSLGGLGPASRFGARLRELSHACGLVVDTGINALGWTREQALAFLRAYLPADDAELEGDYIVVAAERPGELAAATLGARELHGMRRWAEEELGTAFDLAALHHEILRVGSVPLPVLGAHLERWLWEEQQRLRAPPADRPPARP